MLWRSDPERLLQLSGIAECSRRIRSIAFNFGRINEYKAIHESFSHHYLLEPELRTEMIRDKWADYYQTQRQVKAVGPFRLDMLEEAIRNLPSLRAVTFTWTKCPWPVETEVARLFIPDVSIRMAKKEVPDIQQALLDALWTSEVKLDSLTLQPFAFQGLHIPLARGVDIAVGRASCFFGSLHRLSIVLDRKSEQMQQDELETVLSHTPRLRELTLEYLPWSRVQNNPLFLPNTHLPRLETLEIIGAETGLKSLAALLDRHASTIEKLKMVGMSGISCMNENESDDDDDSDVGAVVTTGSAEDTGMRWDDVFKLIHDKFINLHDVTIAELFTDPSGTKTWLATDETKIGGGGASDDVRTFPAAPVEAYLLRRQSSMPDWTLFGF